MLELWVVWRFIKTRRGQFFNMVSCLAITGMILGVAALVVVMAVVSGFESTLREAVVDVTGHILLFKRGEPLDPMEKLAPQLRALVPQIRSMAPFVHVEGMVAHHGRVSGVVVEGFDQSVEKTLNLRHRIVQGVFNLGKGSEKIPPVIVGRGLAEKLHIGLNEEINVVLPKNAPTAKVVGFVPRLKKFKVAGIIDLGMYEYDTRFLLTSAPAAQDLAGFGPVYTGLRIKLSDAMAAPKASLTLMSELGASYFTRDWIDANHNLFEAIRLEKAVIFIVLLFMTVAACFNISSTLFISVLRRYGDIAILKTLGARRGRLLRFFSFQGLIIGFLGSVGGLALGLALCLFISKASFVYVPPEIYHLRHLPVEMRAADLGLILAVSFLLCFLSTLAPAWKGAGMNPIEGLRS